MLHRGCVCNQVHTPCRVALLHEFATPSVVDLTNMLCRGCACNHIYVYLVYGTLAVNRGGGGTQKKFGEYVLHGFPKVGPRERVFLEKWGVVGAKIDKFWVFRAEILAKNRAEKANFFSKLKMGGGRDTWAAHWWKLVGWELRLSWKMGFMTAANTRTSFQW